MNGYTLITDVEKSREYCKRGLTPRLIREIYTALTVFFFNYVKPLAIKRGRKFGGYILVGYNVERFRFQKHCKIMCVTRVHREHSRSPDIVNIFTVNNSRVAVRRIFNFTSYTIRARKFRALIPSKLLSSDASVT